MTVRAFYFVPDSSYPNGLDLKCVLVEVPFQFGASSLTVKVHPTTLGQSADAAISMTTLGRWRQH